MTPYIPKVRVFVDWDGDGFINKGVPEGTPFNLVPYAPFPRSLALRKLDGSYSNKFLFDDAYALVAREVDLDAGELALFGTEYNSIFNPTTNPNIACTYKSTNLTLDGFFFYEENGSVSSIDDGDSSSGTTNYLGGTSSTAEIPAANGQAYTLVFNADYRSGSGSSVSIRNAAGTVRATVVAVQGANYVQWTQPATENIRIQTESAATDIVDYSELMVLEGTVTAPPDGFNVRDVAVMDDITPIVLLPSTNYVMQFIIRADQSCDATITIYRQVLGSVTNNVLYTGIIALTADTDYRLQVAAASDASGSHLHGQIELDTGATLQLRGYSIYEGTVFYPFSAGETAAYDDLTKSGDVLAAKWDIGRRKFSEAIGYEGTAELTLNNQSRKYSPKNSESPLYGSLGKKNLLAYIELEHPTDLSVHKMFTGWTELIDVVVGTRSNLQARLTLRQGMFRLREGAFAPIVYESLRINDVLPTLIEMAGWRYASHPAQAVLDYEQRIGYDAFLATDENVYEREEDSLYTYDLIGQGWDDDTKISDALEDLLEAEGASFWLGREGKLNFVSRTFYLHRPETMDYSLNLDTAQAGSYEYGRDVASVVSVFAKPKDTQKNTVIWSTRPAVEINAGETVRLQMEFSFEGGEPRTITNVREDNIDITGYYQTKNRSTDPEEITAADEDSILASIEQDYQGRYTLVLQNTLTRRVWVTAEVNGDYVIGGEGVTYEFADTDAMLASNGIHRRKISTFLLTTKDEAEGLADTIFLRDGQPEGEFTSFNVMSSSRESVEAMITMQTGDRLYLREYQTAETEKPHVILGEDVKFDGRSLVIKYNVGRLDSTIYGKTGDEIDHELVNVMEGGAEFFGSGEVKQVYRLESDDLIPFVTTHQGTLGTYILGNQPKQTVSGEYDVFNPAFGAVLGSAVNADGNFPEIINATSPTVFKAKGGLPYRFRVYQSSFSGAVSNTLEIGTYWMGGTFQRASTEGSPATESAGGVVDNTGALWERCDGYFLAQYGFTDIAEQPLPLLSIRHTAGARVLARLEYWEKYPVTYLKPNTQYTLHLAMRLAQDYPQKNMTMRIVEVQPPPYGSGDGDNTLDDLAFTPSFDEISFHSVIFTSPATSYPVRLELEFNDPASIPRGYELFEFALVEGAVAPTELGTLQTKNPNVIRLAV